MSPRTTPVVFLAASLVAVAGCVVTTTPAPQTAPPPATGLRPATPAPSAPPTNPAQPSSDGADGADGADAANSPAAANSPDAPAAVDPDASVQLRCVSAGCSGELCVNIADPNAPRVSTCIYRPKFACFMEAQCEVQSNGECGWTVSPELTACLEDARETPSPVPAPQLK